VIYVVADRCTGCGSCVDVCSRDALSLIGRIARIEPELCDACLACLDECPEGAIQASEAVPVHAATQASADAIPALTETFHLGEAIPMLDDDIHEAASREHRGHGRGQGRGLGCRHGHGEGHGHGHAEGRGHGHGEGRGRGRGQGRGGGRGRQRCRERSRLQERDVEAVDWNAQPETEPTTLEDEIAWLKAQAQQLQQALADVSSRLAALERQ
jgi:NAD-dependent dihydropyrimidine dehydrogenase PreA subunit